MSASSYVASVFDLPLLDVREEIIRSLASQGNAQNSVPVAGPSRFSLPQFSTNGTLPVLRDFWPANGPLGIGFLTGAGGVYANKYARVVGACNKTAVQLGFPINFHPAAGALPIPSAALTGRKYTFTSVMVRDALEVGSVFGMGVTSLNGTAGQIPSSAAVNNNAYYFRSLLAENGGNWSVAFRPDFAAALTIVPTTLSAIVPRVFKIEFTEDWNGSGAVMAFSIDGAEILRLQNANLSPPLGLGSSPYWGISIGNDGAAGIGFDWSVFARYRVDSVGGDQ